MSRPLCFVFAMALFLLSGLPLALAQSTSDGPVPGTVSVVGTSAVERQPTLLRMKVVLTGKGKSVEEALAKLKDRREAAALQLESLGAVKESIDAGTPSLAGAGDPNQLQAQRMMFQQLRARGRNIPAGLAAPKQAAVSVDLFAEWPLDNAPAELLLGRVKEIQDKVEQADLAGLNEPQELSPEEQELAEETEQMQVEYGYSGQEEKPGQPQFAFAARITKEERDAALAEAFASAKEQAERLAKAAGLSLGRISSLAGENEPPDAYGAYAAYRGGDQTSPFLARQKPERRGLESYSGQFGPIEFHYSIRVAFRLE